MTPEEQTMLAVQVAELRVIMEERDRMAEERDRKLDGIHLSLKDDLARIEKQTTATNGRVTTGERQLAMLKGAVAALTFGTPFLLFALDRILGG